MTQGKLWEAYIQFLKVWADDHASPLFLGNCPPCFEEWLECDVEEEEE